MENYQDDTSSIGNMIDFFRKLADDLETHKLTPADVLKSGQLYAYWKYKTDPYSCTYSDEDIQKYIMTGWYIYQQYSNLDSNPNDGI